MSAVVVSLLGMCPCLLCALCVCVCLCVCAATATRCAGEELEPWKGLTVGSTRTKKSQFDLQGWTGLGWGILVVSALPAASPLLSSPSSSCLFLVSCPPALLL